MKFKITAYASNKVTGKAITKPRSEVIDTETNSMFRGVRTIWQAHSRYEAYWNDFNESVEEIVVVTKVEKIK